MYNVDSQSWNLALETLARAEVDSQEQRLFGLQEGDVLISRVNSIEMLGKTAWVNHSAQGYVYENMLMRLRFNDEVDSLFIAQQLNTPELRAQVRSCAKKASGQASINSTDVQGLEIIFPPLLSEQRRIAAVLARADRLRRLRRYALELSAGYLQAVFVEMFGDPVTNPKGWDRATVKELGKVQTGNTPSREVPEYYGDHIEWAKSDNILSDEMFVERSREMLSKKGMSVGRVVEAGSLLITCIAGSLTSIGNAAIVTKRVSYNQQINAISPSRDVDPLFLYGLMLTAKPLVRAHATEAMKKMISKSSLEEIVLYKPPLPLQERFAAIARRHERLRGQQREALRQAEQLFAALLGRAFRGELGEAVGAISMPMAGSK